MLFEEQAESCRRQATQYAGRPEAPFLMRVASAFDELAAVDSSTIKLAHQRKTVGLGPNNHA